MSLELVYTSAPRGLKSTVPGFCTVAATVGMSRQVMMKLEALSAYEFHFGLSDPNVRLSPVNFAHSRLAIGGQSLSVLSRIAFAGADYSGRTNKIAHHFALAAGEELSPGPAWMLRQMADGVLCADWREEARDLPPRDLSALLAGRPAAPAGAARRWAQAAGDPGWGGLLLKAVRERKDVPAFVIFSPGADLLPLFEESLALLPPAERWPVGFATCYSTLPAGCYYHWRGILAGSSATREIARFPNAVVIDLTRPLPKAEDNPYTRAARTGEMLAPIRQEAPAPSPRGEPGEKPSWPGVVPESLRARVRAETPLALMHDAADEPPSDAAGQIALLVRNLNAMRRGHREARAFAFGACGVAGLLLLLCIYAFVKWSETSSALEQMKQDDERRPKAAVAEARPGTKPQPPKPPDKPVLSPPERPKTSDVVAPPKVEPPKVAVAKPPVKGPDPVQPIPPEPKATKEVPKVAAPIELRAAGGAEGAPRFPKSDDGEKVVFETGPFDAILGPPPEFGQGQDETLKFELVADDGDAVKVTHRPWKGGFGQVTLLTARRREGLMVWTVEKKASEDYLACLENLVLVVARGTGKEQASTVCMRKRDPKAMDLTLTYRADGSPAGSVKERTWNYPWADLLRVQHKGIAEGRAVLLAKPPSITTGDVLIGKDTGGRFTEIVFKRTVHAHGRPKGFDIRLVLKFTVGDEKDPQNGTRVTAALSLDGLDMYVGDLDDARNGLQRLKGACELARDAEELERLRKSKQDLQAPKDTKELKGVERRIVELEKQESRMKVVFKYYGDGDKHKAIAALRRKLQEELLMFRKETKPDNWASEISEIDEAMKTLETQKALPHQQFKGIEPVIVLDPWNVPLAILTPSVKQEGYKEPAPKKTP